MQKITPCLFFNGNAEKAVKFYVSVFKNSKILLVTHYGESGAKASGQPKGSIMTISFQLDGQKFMALHGGSHFKFSPAISFMANCKTQKEIDSLYKKLGKGGQILPCSWITDQFGISWQIVPTFIEKIWHDKDNERVDRVMNEVFKMKKLDIKTLQKAYQQKPDKKRKKK